MDAIRDDSIKQIGGGSSTDHLQALQSTKVPKFKGFPQYTASELRRKVTVQLDDEAGRERCRVGMLPLSTSMANA